MSPIIGQAEICGAKGMRVDEDRDSCRVISKARRATHVFTGRCQLTLILKSPFVAIWWVDSPVNDHPCSMGCSDSAPEQEGAFFYGMSPGDFGIYCIPNFPEK